MSNRLKNETSPYLLQHADNPVNWYPWGDEAFKKAKDENKPVFLSIGYSTCHWCHVMAHESFEDEKCAEILNKYFVSIKVDREERPDIDSVYMSVCQAFTGSGGWPMSIFMTWDKKPFFAGTYFPVTSRYGMPSFSDLLNTIATEWENNNSQLISSAEEIIKHLKSSDTEKSNIPKSDLIQRAVTMFKHSFDSVNGGFGFAPKFPTPHNLLFLLYYGGSENKETLAMVEKTLIQMRKGGIFDHIGYGFSRYSTDKYYLAPHFEKMLYDNALLIIAYSAVFSITGNKIYLDTAKKTAQYVLDEMVSVDGGFFSAQDADSEGVEGKFYTFKKEEILNVLGDKRGEEFAKTFDITDKGNFEGTNIPNLLKSDDLESNFDDEIIKLYNYRKERFNLHLDDKILLSWNALMIAALSILYRVSGDEKHLDAAKNALLFLEKNLCDGVSLYTSYRDGKRSAHAFLDDYAFFISALIELYNSTLNKEYLNKAKCFCDEAVKQFFDEENGGFYLSKKDRSELFINPKEAYDGAIPSGNSVMTYNFVRLYMLTKNEEYKKFTEKQISFMSHAAKDYPMGHSMFLTALKMHQDPPSYIVVSLKEEKCLKEVTKKLPFLANVVVTDNYKDYPLVNDRTTYYVCNNHTCLPPTNTL